MQAKARRRHERACATTTRVLRNASRTTRTLISRLNLNLNADFFELLFKKNDMNKPR